jgi:hypothetical protein
MDVGSFHGRICIFVKKKNGEGKKRFKRLCGIVEGKTLFANERKFDESMEDLRKFDCQSRFDL